MPELTFPGEGSPAFPRVGVTVPDGWTPLVEPGAVLAAVDSAPKSAFAANVVVTLVRHPASYPLDAAVESMNQELAQLPEASMLPPTEHSVSTDGAVAVVSFVDTRIGALLQVHALLRVPNGPVADYVHVIGTCGGDTTDNDFPLLTAIVEALSVEPGGSAAD